MVSEINIDQRRARESELIAAKGFVPLAILAQDLGVSESTVRRDLEILRQMGVIERTHGGAVLSRDRPGRRMGGQEEPVAALTEKQAIAQVVAGLLVEGQTLVIDGGTTCYQVARAIQGRRLSVITNSVPIAALLSMDVATEVTLVGGYVYPRTAVTLGSIAEAQLERLHATTLVFSCAGLTEQGAFNWNQMIVDVERRMMSIADRVVLAVDHAKFGLRSVVRLCGLEELDVIVTDAGVDERTRQWLATLKARVLFAAPPTGK